MPQAKTHKPPIDCFYVYPTVSEQEGPNADLTIEPQETQIAIDQASRFSQVCQVYAPMYRQLTLKAINTPGGVTPRSAADGLRRRVRGVPRIPAASSTRAVRFVLIGHSQGSAMLEALIQQQIDANAAMRKQLVSAILLGGQVLVPEGQLVGGTFKNVPLCTAGDRHRVRDRVLVVPERTA